MHLLMCLWAVCFFPKTRITNPAKFDTQGRLSLLNLPLCGAENVSLIVSTALLGFTSSVGLLSIILYGGGGVSAGKCGGGKVTSMFKPPALTCTQSCPRKVPLTCDVVRTARLG